MKWYKLTTFTHKCEPIEVIKESAEFVTVPSLRRESRREAKTSDSHCIRPSKAKCWRWKLKRIDDAIGQLTVQIQVKQEDRARAIKDMSADLASEDGAP